MMGTSAVTTWNWHACKRELAGTIKRRMQVAMVALQTDVRESISIPTRDFGPSRPGEPPHRDLGNLHRSIFFRVDESSDNEIIGEVGTALVYGIFHELGLRPFLRPGLLRNIPKIERILSGGKGGGGGSLSGGGGGGAPPSAPTPTSVKEETPDSGREVSAERAIGRASKLFKPRKDNRALRLGMSSYDKLLEKEKKLWLKKLKKLQKVPKTLRQPKYRPPKPPKAPGSA